MLVQEVGLDLVPFDLSFLEDPDFVGANRQRVVLFEVPIDYLVEVTLLLGQALGENRRPQGHFQGNLGDGVGDQVEGQV